MNESDASGNLIPQEAPERAGNYLGSANDHLRVLLAALDMGWQVEEPIYLRPRWGESGSWVYHFILKKEEAPQPCLITVRHSPEIEQMVELEGWQVDQPTPTATELGFLWRADRITQCYFQ